jgi:hypothetical protein
MKAKYLLIIPAIAALIGTQSCSVSSHTKEIKTMDIEFNDLTRSDIIVIGKLQAEATITGKGSPSRYTLDKQYATNRKIGKMNDLVTQFVVERQPSFFEALMGQKRAFTIVTDYGMEFALNALMEKYPDIDYFTNIKTERIATKTGSVVSETVKISADGIELKTDK